MFHLAAGEGAENEKQTHNQQERDDKRLNK